MEINKQLPKFYNQSVNNSEKKVKFTLSIIPMKTLSNRKNWQQNKENLNFTNRLISPQPSRPMKGGSIKTNNQRKIFTSEHKYNLCSTQDGKQVSHFYMDQDGQVLKYCEKCAIMLASKGFNVQKLTKTCMSQRSYQTTQSLMNSTRKFKKQYQKGRSIKQRLSKVQQLKQRIEQCQRQLEIKQTQVEEILIQSGDMYSGLISQVSSYFRIIEHLVEYQKYLAYNRVLTQRVNNEKELRSFKQDLSDLKQTIIHIKQDIIDNQDVVLTVDSHQFDSIIENYCSTVYSVPQLLDSQPQIEPIFNLTLPPVPEILDQLADLITFVKQEDENNPIQSSFQDLRKIISSSKKQENLNSERDKIPRLNLNALQSMNEQQQFFYEDDSSSVSQHSFGMRSALQRQMMNKMPKDSKQILLKNSFSVESSLIQSNDCASSQEQYEDHEIESYQTQKMYQNDEIKDGQLQKWENGLKRMQLSVGHFLN